MTDWSKLKVVDLKAELKKRGLAQTGLKPALVARLTAAENEEGSESEATVQGDASKPAASSATSPDTISPIQPSTDLASQIPHNEPQAVAPETEQEVMEAPAQTPPPAVIEETPIQETPIQEEQLEQTPPKLTATRETPIPVLHSHHSTLPSAEPKEIIEDKNKRKRRSQSPPPSATDAAHKRLKQDDEEMTGMGEVAPREEEIKESVGIDSEEQSADVGGKSGITDFAMKEGTDVVDTASEEREPHAENMALDVKEGPEVVDEPKSEQLSEEKGRPTDNMDVDVKEENEPTDTSPSQIISRHYKDLFTAPSIPSLENSTSRDTADAMDTELPDRIITPARHPATSALYIRNFMRPLNPGQLKKYIADLAAPPGRESDPDVITYFYLDLIRTHAFISFANVAAASRVRSAIHDRIWPDERTRKPLWADFVPAEKVEVWSEEEQAAGGGRSSAKKWEVNYEVDEDRNVKAYLQEITNFPGPRPQPPVRHPSIPVPPPQAPFQPRGIENAPSGPRASQNRAPRAMNGFSTLDQLFKSTTTKPLLYWKPVDKAIADKRLDNIDSVTSRNAQGRRVEGELNRYTFEDIDVFVDRGPEIFPGIRPPPGFRGPRGGGGNGPPRRGAGGYGRPERYDSYRRDGRRDDRRY